MPPRPVPSTSACARGPWDPVSAWRTSSASSAGGDAVSPVRVPGRGWGGPGF